MIKTYFLDYYEVSTGSMSPTIVPGQGIVIRKNATSIAAFDITFHKNDVVVFYKPDFDSTTNRFSKHEAVYVKRCVGLPGDTVFFNRPTINTTELKSLYKSGYQKAIFPHDSAYTWTITRFGPLWIPQKNAQIPLTKTNLILYKKMIEAEGNYIYIEGDHVFINRHEKKTYKFRNNYYFMVGDNFYASEDSRYWGPVAQSSLIGKRLF